MDSYTHNPQFPIFKVIAWALLLLTLSGTGSHLSRIANTLERIERKVGK